MRTLPRDSYSGGTPSSAINPMQNLEAGGPCISMTASRSVAGTVGPGVADDNNTVAGYEDRTSKWKQHRSGKYEHITYLKDLKFLDLRDFNIPLEDILHRQSNVGGAQCLLLNWTGVWLEMFGGDNPDFSDTRLKAQKERSSLRIDAAQLQHQLQQPVAGNKEEPKALGERNESVKTVLGRQSPLLVVLLNIFYHPWTLSLTIVLYILAIFNEAVDGLPQGQYIAFFGYIQGLIGVILSSYAIKGSLFCRVRLFSQLCYCQNNHESEPKRKDAHECIICLCEMKASNNSTCCCWLCNCCKEKHHHDDNSETVKENRSHSCTSALMRNWSKRCVYFLHSLEMLERLILDKSECLVPMLRIILCLPGPYLSLPMAITSNDLPKPAGLYPLLERITLFGDEMRHPGVCIVDDSKDISSSATINATNSNSGASSSSSNSNEISNDKNVDSKKQIKTAVDEQIEKFGRAPAQFLILSIFITAVYFLYVLIIGIFSHTWCVDRYGSNNFCDHYAKENERLLLRVLVAAGNSLGATTLIVALMALFYAVQLCHEQVRQWMKRYLPCRRTDADKYLEIKNEEISPTITRLRLELRRDAQERYLLIQYFAKSVSQLFGTFLVEDLCVRTIIVVLCYWQIVTLVTQEDSGIVTISQVLGWVVAYQCFAIIFDILCISYGNNVNWLLQNYFSDAGHDDYQMIGGRSQWLEYIKSTQIRWEIAQYQVTYTSLASVIGSLVTAGVSTLVIAGFSGGDGRNNNN